jgi:hypothetical protein
VTFVFVVLGSVRDIVVMISCEGAQSQKAARKSRYRSTAVDCLAKSCEITSMVVRKIKRGLPGMKRSTSARAQQAIWTIRRAAMQRRNEESLDMLKVGELCL